MHSKTKIVVLHMKELIYTGIFVVLGVFFIILLILMFVPKDSNTIAQTLSENGVTNSYIPGVYTTTIDLNNYSIDVEVVVDEALITSLRLVNLDENIASIYPLIEPSFDAIANQLTANQSLTNITYEQDSTYTSQLLLNALDTCLDNATIPQDDTH